MRTLILRLFNPENEFFKLTAGAKRLTHISLSSFLLPIIFLATAGALTQFVFAPLIIGESGESAPWVRQVFGLIFMFGSLILIIMLWTIYFEGRPIYTLGFPKDGALKKYLTGFSMGILLNTIVVGIMAVLGSIEIADNSVNLTGTSAIGIVIVFLIGFIVQGAGEEILARGWMMQVIGSRYKPWLGVLISTIIFAVLHLGNSGVNPISVVNLVLVSLLWSMFVLNNGSLWYACAWHSSWNWMLGNVYGLSVSGTGEKVSLFDLNTTGNEVISGGAFGPEGSVVTTFVLIVAIIWYGVKILKKA